MSSFYWDITNNEELRSLIRGRKSVFGLSNENLRRTTERIFYFLQKAIRESNFEQRILVENKLKENFNSNLYLDFFSLKKNIKTIVVPDRGTISKFLRRNPKTERPQDSTLDFFAVFLGYAGINGYLNNVSLDDCFQFSKINELKPDEDIHRFLVPEKAKKDLSFEKVTQKFTLHEDDKSPKIDPPEKDIKLKINPFSFRTIRGKLLLASILVLLLFSTYFSIKFLPDNSLKFLEEQTGILVLAFDGDTGNELQRDLTNTLIQEFGNNNDFNIQTKSEVVSLNNGIDAAHSYARKVGVENNSYLVIWGDVLPKKQKSFLKITVVDNPIRDYIYDNYTYNSVDIGHFELPWDFIDKPIVLINFLQGYYKYRNHKYQEAIQYLQRVLNYEWDGSIKPEGIYNLLGVCYTSLYRIDLDESNYRNANHNFLKVLQSNKSDFYTYANRAILYGLKGKYQLAIQDFTSAIKIDSLNYKVFNGRGYMYHKINENQLALEDLNKALDIKPDYINALINRGNVFFFLGEIDSATRDYKVALNIDSENIEAMYGIGQSYLKQSNLKDAQKWLKLTISKNPQHYWALINLGLIQKNLNHPDQAVILFNQAAETNKDTCTNAYNYIGLIYQNKKEYRKALAYYKIAERIDTNNCGTLNNIGLLYKDLNILDSAILYYQKSTYIQPSNPHAWNNLGLLYYYDNQGNIAIECFLTALHIKPNFPNALNNLGLVYFSLNDFDKAIDCYQQAIKQDSLFQEPYINLRILYKKIGLEED